MNLFYHKHKDVKSYLLYFICKWLINKYLSSKIVFVINDYKAKGQIASFWIYNFVIVKPISVIK